MKYKIKVQTWYCVEATVSVEADTDRHAREKALVDGHQAQQGLISYITKNKTTILQKDGILVPNRSEAEETNA